MTHADNALSDQVVLAMSERRDRTPVQVRHCPAPYVASEESSLVHWLNRFLSRAR